MRFYEEQLARVGRFYDRFKRLNAGVILDRDVDEYLDDVYAFFVFCYHVKDYLRNDKGFTVKHSEQEIEDYITKTKALAICADICNGSKHLVRNRRPRSGHEPKLGPKQISIEVTEHLSGRTEPTTLSVKISVQHNTDTLDAFQIATDALQAWRDFVGQ